MVLTTETNQAELWLGMESSHNQHHQITVTLRTRYFTAQLTYIPPVLGSIEANKPEQSS